MSEAKRFRRGYTLIEQLPNELFIEIFAFLRGVDTVYAFSQLNTRFQSLLIQHVNSFDFQSISKAKFDHVIQHHDIQQWRSLRLSEDDQTPGQIILFCQLYPSHQYISQLKSLCVVNMTPTYAQEFISQLVSFDHLVSLEIGNICGEKIQPFELPSLKRLVVTACKNTAWMMKFHSLQNLDYNIEYNCCHDHAITLPTTLKQLKMLYDKKIERNTVQTVLRQLSQLTKLALYDKTNDYQLPDGREWEKFFQSSLPLLKTFQFCFSFQCYRTMTVILPPAVTSFSTPFYLSEKRWFIRCIIAYHDHTIDGIFYSVPYAFSQLPINTTSFNRSMSTLPVSETNETKYESYEEVKTLFLNTRCPTPYRRFHTSNIVRLVINSSFSTDWIPLLSNLHHLEIRNAGFTSSSDFSRLLENTSQLRSLTISAYGLITLTEDFQNTSLRYYMSQRIRSLTLANFFDDKLTLDVVQARLLSPLVRIFGKKCEHLSFALAAHPDTVLPILQRMKQLRSLHIHLDPWHRKSRNIAKSWLEKQPKGSIQSEDFVHITDENDYYVWFGNRP